ncbi:MAG TPA: sulfotransferase, partial [Myxococcota bacterium]|nr:sulfotransferase [Myxococcota bacterium]
RGRDWYAALFAGASASQLCGESSTHYTKLPTHPEAARRMYELLPKAKLVYVMRDPLERLVSQYLHEWSTREVEGSLEQAVTRHERFVAYSSYARQLEQFVELWGRAAILPVFFERLVAFPDEELGRICRFLGDPSPEPPVWRQDLEPQNVTSERMRTSALRDALLGIPAVRWLKDQFPQSLRERVKELWKPGARPQLTPELRARLERTLDQDLTRLGEWLGTELSCHGWTEQVLERALEWKR